MRRAVLAIYALGAACGRIGFDPAARATDGSPAPDFCASLAPPATFCADFDGSGSAALDWGSPGQMDLGQLAVDSSESTSAPSSLLVTLPATTDAAAVASVFLRRDFSGNLTDVTLAFDLRVDAKDLGGAVFATLGFSNANVVHSIEYVWEMSDVQFEEVLSVSDVPTFTYYNLPLPALGAWHRVTYRVVFTGSNAELTSSLDGAQVLDTPLSTGDAGNLFVELGIPYHAGSSGPWAVRFDNVTLDAN